MSRLLAAYAATVAVLVALDLLWLGLIAKPLYQRGIGHLMAETPNIPVAVLFYVVYCVGLMVFVLVPGDNAAHSWPRTVLMAALFGFFAYATYDLTNLATLKDWPIRLSLIDMAWGTLVSMAAACAGKAVLNRMAAGG